MKSSELTKRDEERVRQLIDAAHDAGAEGLIVSSSGNFSVRLGEQRIAISAARARLGRLRREELVVLDLSRNEPGVGPPRPSRETPLHCALYRADPALGAVLHFQSPAATALACRAGPLPDLNFIPEIPVYVREVGDVPYLAPGGDALAQAVAAAFRPREVRLVQLRNHGQVVQGDSPAQAVERAVFFELACRIVLRSEGRGALRSFTAAELEHLRGY